MKNTAFKILVLSDLKSNTNSTLLSAISIANIVGGSITLLHVKQPSKVVTKESQLSAMRVINQEFTETNKKIQDIINPLAKEFDISIDHVFSLGNVKGEIDQHIEEIKPDLLFLGKRKPSLFNITGDNLTDHILSKHTQTTVFVDDDNILQQPITLGLLNSNTNSLNNNILKSLLQVATTPVISFNVANKQNTFENIEKTTNDATVNYVFEQNDNTIKNLAAYITKNKVNLLSIHKENSKGSSTKSNILSAIDNLTTSLIVTSH